MPARTGRPSHPSRIVRTRDPVDLPAIEPLMPDQRADAFNHPDWLFEPKYDGIRALAYVTPSNCSFASPRNAPLDRASELLLALPGQVNARDAILDGEIVALDRHGRPSRRELSRSGSAVAFAVFDLLWLNGRDLRGLPLTRRKRLLDLAVPANTAHLMKVLSIQGDGVALFKATEKLDLEGIVAKRRDGAYDNTAQWFAMRNPAYSQAPERP